MRLPFSLTSSPAATGLREQAEAMAEALPPLVAEAERIASTIAQGVHGRRRTGSGESFWQFRRYREGDPATAVDWRHSARSSHLFVREIEHEASQSIWIWRDASPSMNYSSEPELQSKKDRASVLALALASLLVQGGENVAILGTGMTPISGRAAQRRVAHELLDAPMEKNKDATDSLPPAEKLPRFGQVVLFSDFLSPVEEIAARIRGYASDGIRGHLVQILDPAEEDLPFTGRIEFEGVEDDTRLMVGRAERLRKTYYEKLMLHRQGLMDAAQTVNFTFAVHRTDRAPHSALLALYGALSGAANMSRPPRAGG